MNRSDLQRISRLRVNEAKVLLGDDTQKELGASMAEEVVVKELLTGDMIEAGAELTRRLDSAGLEVTASLWLYLPESGLWRLKIASPEVNKFGPRKVYQKIQSVLSQLPKGLPCIALADISAVENGDPLIILLRKAIKTSDGVSGIRFSNNAINGHFIEDAYIYRLT